MPRFPLDGVKCNVNEYPGRVYRNAVIRRHINRGQARRSDALHSHLLRRERNRMFRAFLITASSSSLVGCRADSIRPTIAIFFKSS